MFWRGRASGSQKRRSGRSITYGICAVMSCMSVVIQDDGLRQGKCLIRVLLTYMRHMIGVV